MSELVKSESGSADVAGAEQIRQSVTYTPRFDVWENEEELILYGDLPGVNPQDLDVRFEDKQLSIHGRVQPRQPEVEYLYGEYGIGDFYRSFAIGEAIDAGKISAELKNGVLTLHLPKTEAVKPKRIEVKAG